MLKFSITSLGSIIAFFLLATFMVSSTLAAPVGTGATDGTSTTVDGTTQQQQPGGTAAQQQPGGTVQRTTGEASGTSALTEGAIDVVHALPVVGTLGDLGHGVSLDHGLPVASLANLPMVGAVAGQGAGTFGDLTDISQGPLTGIPVLVGVTSAVQHTLGRK